MTALIGSRARLCAAILQAAILAGCASAEEQRIPDPSTRAPRLMPAAECAAFGPAPRDYAGRVIRNTHARADFRKLERCPATGRTAGACPGWVVDHVIALKRGGPDHPCNMQWQTGREAREKDRFE